MQRILCKSKIHRAPVTEADLNYNGSITIDSALLKAADMFPFEQVHVANTNNGQRFVTYTIEGTIEGASNSGVVCVLTVRPPDLSRSAI